MTTQMLPAYSIGPGDVILTFDCGSNSLLNFASLPFSFICEHTMTGLSELYDSDLDEYQEIVFRNGYVRRAYEIPDLTFSESMEKAY